MKRTCLSILLVGILCLSACISRVAEPLPIPEDELIKLLFDVHVVEGALAQLPGGPKKDSLANLYYDQVSEIHKVDRQLLDTCLAILQRNPETAKDIYEKVGELAEKKKLVK